MGIRWEPSETRRLPLHAEQPTGYVGQHHGFAPYSFITSVCCPEYNGAEGGDGIVF